jgi:hypothetical protein
MILLNEVKRQILKNAMYIPEKDSQFKTLLSQNIGGIMQTIDHTVRYPVGKILLNLHDIQNFEWEGES